MREFGSQEVEAALDRAAERGFLNDLDCARDLARVRVERRHEGPVKLFAELARRGVDTELARQVVAESFAMGEDEPLREATSLWLVRNGWDRDRLARHLGRKGFSPGAILSTLERLRSDGTGGAGSDSSDGWAGSDDNDAEAESPPTGDAS